MKSHLSTRVVQPEPLGSGLLTSHLAGLLVASCRSDQTTMRVGSLSQAPDFLMIKKAWTIAFGSFIIRTSYLYPCLLQSTYDVLCRFFPPFTLPWQPCNGECLFSFLTRTGLTFYIFSHKIISGWSQAGVWVVLSLTRRSFQAWRL
jgi:hypothetical protein